MHGQQIVDKVVLEETYKASSEGIIYTEDQSQRKPDFPVEEIPFTYGMGWQNAVYRGMCVLMYKIPSNMWHGMAQCCI